MRKAEISLKSTPKIRRSSKEVAFDRRWDIAYSFPEYISTYFLINCGDVIKAQEKWKELVIDVITEREKGIPRYNSLLIPINNVSNK
jgi:hypothetical protein